HPWNVPTHGPGRYCSNALIECPNAATHLCSRCNFDKYCSRECQKQFWSRHKQGCISYPKEPVHEIVSSDPTAPNYYKADAANPKSLDRPNIFIDIRNKDGDESLACLDNRLQRQYVVYHIRCDFYGVARYPKTIIITDHENLATSLLDLIRDSTFTELAEWNNIKHWFRVVHEETPATERQALLEIWSRIDSDVRVLITSPLSELEFIVPDVENVIVFSTEGPRAMGPRWQRMARMAHQKGVYMQIVRKEGSDNEDYKVWGGLGCNRDLELIGGDRVL
ncbi:hypothetical protein BKA65DRAFT_491617, partial [Rhexocercosporidium sp. MPI-PUGE-AT-0058]